MRNAAFSIGLLTLLLADPASAGPNMPPYPGTTVAVTNCGANVVVAAGSSPFNGAVIPDATVTSCYILFTTTQTLSPWNVIVDGSTTPGDYIAPICNSQIQGPRTKWTVALTAAGVKFGWDENIAKPVAPPKWISWTCAYPWTPAGQTN